MRVEPKRTICLPMESLGSSHVDDPVRNPRIVKRVLGAPRRIRGATGVLPLAERHNPEVTMPS